MRELKDSSAKKVTGARKPVIKIQAPKSILEAFENIVDLQKIPTLMLPSVKRPLLRSLSLPEYWVLPISRLYF